MRCIQSILSALFLVCLASYSWAYDLAPWTEITPMSQPRQFHSTLVLPNGKVMVVAGNYSPSIPELYDPATQQWSNLPAMNVARDFPPPCVLLQNGKVLAAGGDFDAATAEIYDPQTNSWSATGAMKKIRYDHSVTLLADGKVFVAGGYFFGTNTPVLETEIYNPADNTWTLGPSLSSARFEHTATLMNDGRVLIAGGYDSLTIVEIYNPATNTIVPAASLHQGRKLHSAVLLPDGQVMVIGGAYVSSCERYDPVNNTWTTTASLSIPRYYAAATMYFGKVYVVGGYSTANPNATVETASVEIYTPSTNTWSAGSDLKAARAAHTVTVLPNSDMLAVGGTASPYLHSVELFQRRTQTVSFDPIADQVYGSTPPTLSATATSGLSCSFRFVSGPAVLNGSTLNITAPGTITLGATQYGDDNYSAATEVQQSFDVTKATPSLSWATPADIVSGTGLGNDQLNATANVAGTFTYSPPPGTVLSNVGSHLLSVHFTPQDFTRYNEADASVLIKVVAANHAPTMDSVISISPDPFRPGTPATFSVSASDADGDTLTYSWNFGDGSTGFGDSVSHTFSSVGPFTVSVTASDGKGGNATAAAMFTGENSGGGSQTGTASDSDGDGFSDALEIAAGSNPNLASDTPLGTEPAPEALPLPLSKLLIKLNFRKPGSDSITFVGTVLLGDKFDPSVQRLLVEIGGVARAFTLDPRGISKNGNDRVVLHSEGKAARTARLTVHFDRGNFAGTLAAIGLTNSNSVKGVTIPVTVLLNGLYFQKFEIRTYISKAGKSAFTRDLD